MHHAELIKPTLAFKKSACLFGLLAFGVLLSGCPTGTPELGVSQGVHDFRGDDCYWTFYVYNGGDGAATFRVTSNVPWAKTLAPGGVVGPGGHTPVRVWIDRRKLAKSDVAGGLTIRYGNDAGFDDFVGLYATDGSEDLVRVRDYWPFVLGHQWTFARHAEDVGGTDGDTTLIDTTKITVTGHSVRFGFDIWEMEYEDFAAKSSKSVYVVFVDEIPVFTDSTEVLDLLPNRYEFIGAAYSGPYFFGATRGLVEPAMDGVNSNTTRYTTGLLSDEGPVRVSGVPSKYRVGEFPVPRSTPCFGLYSDPVFEPHQRKILLHLLARDTGPLLDPFRGGAILHSFSFAYAR